jgi:endogenous inhibitor of DNA gyrase (YacG/DUF329 family)
MALCECPICHKAFDREQSRSMPFCSARCRQIDLGRWLNEEQRLPYARDEEDGESELPADAS